MTRQPSIAQDLQIKIRTRAHHLLINLVATQGFAVYDLTTLSPSTIVEYQFLIDRRLLNSVVIGNTNILYYITDKGYDHIIQFEQQPNNDMDRIKPIYNFHE